MRPAVVQLGAGPVQRDLMKAIAGVGLAPIVVDRAESPAGLPEGAIHVRAPIDDPAAILAPLAKACAGLDVGAVLTSTDLGVGSVSPIAAALGLPHAPPESIALMDDKHAAKQAFSQAGLLVPEGRLVQRGEGSGPVDSDREYVVKPVDASGSRGVRRVRGAPAVEEALREAFAFGARCLIEECVEGDHYDVNGFVRDGRFTLVSIGRRFFTPAPACVPIYGGIDAGWGLGLADRVCDAMQRAVDVVGYDHGPVKADVIDAERGLVLLELAARFHGDVFSHHTSLAAGLAPAAIRWLSHLDLCPPPTDRSKQGAWVAVFAERAGTIAGIEGLEALKAHRGFRVWIPRLGVGDRVVEPSDNRALVGFGILGFEQRVDLFREAREARSLVRVPTR
ncbi:MAG: ATP-grasp domain-containing protein [Spirochaetaceae bacterium]|nr:ATP-grasp domain-containing protein [Myxococcales bacterium]MCB9724312.1 ATP-grasp domain-containing protein [Spirochaetaceae bacterium]